MKLKLLRDRQYANLLPAYLIHPLFNSVVFQKYVKLNHYTAQIHMQQFQTILNQAVFALYPLTNIKASTTSILRSINIYIPNSMYL